MKRITLILAIVVLGICSCKEEVPVPESELLIGSWNWEMTSGGFIGGTSTPESRGVTQGIEFRDDGKYFIFTDGDISEFGEYTLQYEGSLLLDRPAYIIRFNGMFTGFAVSEISKRKLIIVQECVSCFVHEYSR